MKKICLYRKENGNENLQGRYDNVEEAQDTVKKLTEDEGNGSIFDYFYKEEDYEEITDRVKTYEDACKVLGVEPINEQNAKAQGFRSDEIARRKLETIAAALNEGWKPDWNNTDQYKYYPYFYIQENAKGKGSAGLSSATTTAHGCEYDCAYRLSALLLRFTFGTVRGQPIYRLIRTNFN